MNQTFSIRFVGEDAKPAAMDIGDLAEMLLSIEQVVAATVGQQMPEIDTSKLMVGLVGIQNKSIGLRFTAAAIVSAALALVGSAVTQRDYEDVPVRAIAGLRAIDQYSKERGWSVEMYRGKNSEPFCTIPADRDIYLPVLKTLTGRTTLYGKLQRVGGVRPRAWLRLLNGGSLSVDMTEGLAKQMSGRLYEVIGLNGEAEWHSDTLTVLSMRADGLAPFEDATLTSAIDELEAALGDGWIGGDVDAAVRDLRGEPETI